MRGLILCCGLTFLSALASDPGATTIIVKPDGTGDFPTIQEAIWAAWDGVFIELTDGTFTGDGNWDLDYMGKAITIMSQSGEPNLCVIDCADPQEQNHTGFHFETDEGPGSVLRGVTILNGRGAIRCDSASPTIEDCVFEAGVSQQGGAAYLWGSAPQFSRCEFVDCTADTPHEYGGGGAVYCIGSNPTFTDCAFRRNTVLTNEDGGAVYSWDIDGTESHVTLLDCLFEDNTTPRNGSALGCTGDAHVTMTRCTFTGNSAGGGGAVYCTDGASVEFAECLLDENSGGAICVSSPSSSLVLTGCTLVHNTASRGAGLSVRAETATISNCTFFGNSAEEGAGIYVSNCFPTTSNIIVAGSLAGEAIACSGGAPDLSCCDLYGNAGGDWDHWAIRDQLGVNGNICEDPLFCDPGGGDFGVPEDSPCAPYTPPNEECDLIGAWPVGCPVSDVPEEWPPHDATPKSWGSIKAMYR
jgi:predicted outer membrane repeat protein